MSAGAIGSGYGWSGYRRRQHERGDELKPKIRQILPKDLKGLNKLNAGVYYPPDQDRAQLRGGKRSFAKPVTRRTDTDEERSA
jgi:hypothetical protein